MGDVVFLVHTSINPQHARSVRNFLYALANSFQVGRETIRVSLAQYSDTPVSEFLLSTYYRKGDVLRHIHRLQFKPGGNKMGRSLQFILEHHFQEAAGSRASQGVPQMALVLSSGPAEDSIREPAEALRRAGILLYAVGVREAAQAELREIASSPKDKFTFFVPNFAGLPGLAQKLRQELCSTLLEAQPTEHQSPGTLSFFLIWIPKNPKLCLSCVPLLLSHIYVGIFKSEIRILPEKAHLYFSSTKTSHSSCGPFQPYNFV